MNILLDTNAIYQLYGYDKNHKDIKQNNITQLHKDFISQKDKYIITNYTLYEIITHKTYSTKYKKNLLDFLNKHNIDIVYITRGELCSFNIDEYCDLTEEQFGQLTDFCYKEKIKIEISELRELFSIIMSYIKFAYEFLADYSLQSLGYVTNVRDVIEKFIEESREHILEKVEGTLQVIINDYYYCKDKEIDIGKIYKEFVLKLVKEIHEILDKSDDNLKNFINFEQEELKKYKNSNVLLYCNNISKRIQKYIEKDDESTTEVNKNLIEYIKTRYTKELAELKYPKQYIDYYSMLIEKYLKFGNFDKNDFIDSYLFRFLDEGIYLMSFETKIINNVGEENHKYIKQYIKWGITNEIQI